MIQDNHLHTNFSYDCEETFDNYLPVMTEGFVTTEHFDLSNPYSGNDDIPDYEAYCEKISILEEQLGIRIKKGIEIGYYQPRENDILDYLSDKQFDLKLLSVHHNGQFDYLQREFVFPLGKDNIIPRYFEALEYAIGRVEADVLAHFDYGFRPFEITVEELKEYEPQLIRIFEKMMRFGLAFEINSKSMYLYEHEQLYRYALDVLKKLGCTLYSIGSDGHKLEHYALYFDRVSDLLVEYGITSEMLIH